MVDAMTENFLVYFVTEGPVRNVDEGGEEYWQVRAQCSLDDGETVESIWFAFGTLKEASVFKHRVNSEMEPTVIGEEK